MANKTKELHKKMMLTNRHDKNIWEVIEHVQTLRPILADSIYKDGWDACMDLIKFGINRIETPDYVKEINALKEEISTLTSK